MAFLDNSLTPLIVTTRYGYLHSFEILLDCIKKANINQMTKSICLNTKARSTIVKPNIARWTALTLAIRYSHYIILRHLLEYEGINISVILTKFEKRGDTT